MFKKATDAVSTASTADLATFAKVLNDTGLDSVMSDGIEWWNATTAQKTDLLKAVPAGAQQQACKDLLSDYTLKVPVDPGVSQRFVTDEFDRSGWFQYYYYEAAGVKNTLTQPQQETLLLLSNALFYKQSKSGPPGTYGLKTPFESLPDPLLQGILFELLTLGFHRIPATAQDAIAGRASDAAIMGKMLWAGDERAVEGTDIKSVTVKAKWRGDSRGYADIKAATGFLTKAHSDGYAKSKNLTEDWHPLKLDIASQCLWFRKSQKDNCLYTVVSVGKAGKEWRTYLPYPLIKLSGGKVTGLRGYLGTKKVKCVPATGGATVDLDLPVSETSLYLFVLAGLILDTGAMQGDGNYPEVGVGEIPFKNVFGAVRFLRYHLGDVDTVNDDVGVVAIRSDVTRNDDNMLTIQASYGDKLFVKLGDRFNTAATLGSPVGVKWAAAGDGYATFDPYATEFTFKGTKYKIASPFTAS